MLTLIPLIHGIQNVIGLMDRLDRALGDYPQLFIGNNSSNLNNQVGVRIKTCHFKVDPDQIIFAFQLMPPLIATRIVTAAPLTALIGLLL